MIAHRWIVIAGWLILTLVGALAAAQSGHRLSHAFDLPGQPGYETNTAILARFGSGGDDPPLVVAVRLPAGVTVNSAGVKRELASVFDATSRALPGGRVASWVSTGDRTFVSADGRTTFELAYPVPAFSATLAGQRVDGSPVYVTGSEILSSGGQSGGSSVLAETMLAGLGALAVLAVVFGSLVALTPLLIAAVAIPSAFTFVYALTYLTTMSFLVQNILALVGLGVAIDYALLIVTRWREERANGRDNRAAVLTASATAGRSVLFSGITVTVSLAALALTSVPFLRSIGLAGMLIPLLSVVVSATLLPVILDAIGPRLEWPRRRPARTLSPLWTRIGTGVVAHPAWAAAGALVVLGVLIAPIAALNLGEPEAVAEAATAPASARAGIDLLTSSGIGTGVLRPTEVLLPAATSLPSPGDGVTVTAPAAWTAGGLRVADAWSAADRSSSRSRSPSSPCYSVCRWTTRSSS
jgi:RND superfamily putative drug exporter